MKLLHQVFLSALALTPFTGAIPHFPGSKLESTHRAALNQSMQAHGYRDGNSILPGVTMPQTDHVEPRSDEVLGNDFLQRSKPGLDVDRSLLSRALSTIEDSEPKHQLLPRKGGGAAAGGAAAAAAGGAVAMIAARRRCVSKCEAHQNEEERKTCEKACYPDGWAPIIFFGGFVGGFFALALILWGTNFIINKCRNCIKSRSKEPAGPEEEGESGVTKNMK